MKKFKIKDLERFSGIKTHTLRTWEQRYGMLTPDRGTGNFRLYSINDVKAILNIALLNRNGYRISGLSVMDINEIENRINQLNSDDDRQQVVINELLYYMYSLKTVAFEAILNKCFINWSLNTVVKDIIFPFLQKAGLFWQGNHLTEEHFVVTTMRKTLMLCIDKAEASFENNRVVLMFLTDARQLDLALLYAHYQLKVNGIQVLYMGNDVSLSNLKAVYDTTKPDFLFTYLPQKENNRVKELTAMMKDQLPGAQMVISTYPQIHLNGYHQNIYIKSFNDALAFLIK